MPFILNEDAALKNVLTGMTVSDGGNAARPVGVWFGQPDAQIRPQAYPYITLDLIGVYEAVERTHVGIMDLPYTPEGYNENTDYQAHYPIAVDLMYQITTYARQPRHDRQILAQILRPGRLPLRFGMLAVPEDKTARRLDMLGFSKRDFTEADKRMFSNVFTVSVSSEIFRENLDELHLVLNPPIITFTSQGSVFTPPNP